MNTKVGHRRELINTATLLTRKIASTRKLLGNESLGETVTDDMRDMFNTEIWLNERTLALIEETLISGEMEDY